MKNIFYRSLMFLSAGLLLTACLKDTGYTDVQEDTNSKTVAFFIPGGVQTQSLKSQAGAQTFTVLVGLSNANRSGDVTVNIGLDPTAVTPGFTAYPAANVSFSPSALTFKPTDTELPVRVTVTNTNAIDPCTRYMIPIVIKDAGGAVVASNQKGLISIPIANPFSGAATATGVFIHPTAGARPYTNMAKTLATIDCKTVKTSVGDLGGNSGYQLGIRINADNSLTLTNVGDGSGAPFTQNNNATCNKYNPATKTFCLDYQYDIGGAVRNIRETIKLN